MNPSTTTNPSSISPKRRSGSRHNHHNEEEDTHREVGHYVVTSHRPGGVQLSLRCSFLGNGSLDIAIVKSRHLEIRSLPSPPEDPSLPLLLSIPTNGRITTLLPLRDPSFPDKQCLFFLTEQLHYAIISYSPPPTPSSNDGKGAGDNGENGEISLEHVQTHTAGQMGDGGAGGIGGGGCLRARGAECGPIGVVEPNGRCVVLHVQDGFLSVLPVLGGRKKGGGGGGVGVGKMFDVRVEERTVLDMAFLVGDGTVGSDSGKIGAVPVLPQLSLLHQDARGNQHVVTHSIDVSRRSIILYSNTTAPTVSTGVAHSAAAAAGGGEGRKAAGSSGGGMGGRPPDWTDRLRKSRVDGGSRRILPVPPPPLVSPPASAAAGLVGDGVSTEPATTKSLTLPETMGGILILGTNQITYHCTQHGVTKVLPVPCGVFTAAIVVDLPSGGTEAAPPPGKGEGGGEQRKIVVRYLLGDEHGRLQVLTVTSSPPASSSPSSIAGEMEARGTGSGTAGGVGRRTLVDGIHLHILGTTSIPHSLVYLRDDLVFIGSGLGDSQLIQITTKEEEQLPNNNNTTTSPTLKILEEYTNLGPISDLTLLPTTHDSPPPTSPSPPTKTPSRCHSHRQSTILTASGVGKDGTVRLVRNGVGMYEHARVGLTGVQKMWAVRRRFGDGDDGWLVQSYVGETRVLGVVEGEGMVEGMVEEDGDGDGDDNGDDGGGGGTLEETFVPGLDAGCSTLYVGNVHASGDDNGIVSDTLVLQITETEVRVVDTASSSSQPLVARWSPNEDVVLGESNNDDDGDGDFDMMGGLDGGGCKITVAAANESGQIAVALRGGMLIYLSVTVGSLSFPMGGGGGSSSSGGGGVSIVLTKRTQLDREISCMNLNPFQPPSQPFRVGYHPNTITAMDVDDSPPTTTNTPPPPRQSELLAVGLWDDFAVRLLSLSSTAPLVEVLRINLDVDSATTAEGGYSGHGLLSQERPVQAQQRVGSHTMARDLCLVTLDSTSSSSSASVTGRRMGGRRKKGGAASSSSRGGGGKADTLLVGLGDGGLIGYAVSRMNRGMSGGGGGWRVYGRKEVSLGTRGITLVPFRNYGGGGGGGSNGGVGGGGTCVLATGDRPTVIYLAGSGGGGGQGSMIPKLCFSNVNLERREDDEDEDDDDEYAEEDEEEEKEEGTDTQQQHHSKGDSSGRDRLSVNVATPFYSSILFDLDDDAPTTTTTPTTSGSSHQHNGGGKGYSLCVSDETTLRLGTIDDIQKLHVSTHKLYMTPRRVAYHESGRVVCVACIDDRYGAANGGVGGVGAEGGGGGGISDEVNMGNCVRIFDDTSFEEMGRIDMDPYEMILSMASTEIKVVTTMNAATSATTDTNVSDKMIMDYAKTAMDDGGESKDVGGTAGGGGQGGGSFYRSYIVIGTAYVFPDEDEPSKGRILVLQCTGGGGGGGIATTSATAASTATSDYPSSHGTIGGHLTTTTTRGRGAIRRVAELQLHGGAYSICPFYDGTILVTVNSKTRMYRLVDDGGMGGGGVGVGVGVAEEEDLKLVSVGSGHHGHILSLCVHSLHPSDDDDNADRGGGQQQHEDHHNEPSSQLAIVGDLMRSIAVLRYHPSDGALEEIARDFNPQWTTAIEMLGRDVYLGAENFGNLFVLRRNAGSNCSEELRCRLDTSGLFHLGEMVNKFVPGTLVVPPSSDHHDYDDGRGGGRVSSSGGGGSGYKMGSSPSTTHSHHQHHHPIVTIGSRSLFGTVDGTLGSILGMDLATTTFFVALETAMVKIIKPIGNLRHGEYRAFRSDRRTLPARGFVDGDLVEAFLDLSERSMKAVVAEMNREGRWEVEGGGNEAEGGCIVGLGETEVEEGKMGRNGRMLVVNDVLSMVEEMAMMH